MNSRSPTLAREVGHLTASWAPSTQGRFGPAPLSESAPGGTDTRDAAAVHDRRRSRPAGEELDIPVMHVIVDPDRAQMTTQR
jgi:hypothetical protein